MPNPKRRVNWFATVVTVAAILTVIAIGAIIVTQGNGMPTASETRTPDSRPIIDDVAVDAKTGTVSFGTGRNTVDTYLDFLCPYCHQFEATEGETLQQLIADRRITLRIHPVSILDARSLGTRYSSRAAGAFFAVAEADPAHAYVYFAQLFNNTPPENTGGLTDAQLVQLAKASGVKMTSGLERAITSRRYQAFARSLALPAGAAGTPTVIVNGTPIRVTFDPKTDVIDRLE